MEKILLGTRCAINNNWDAGELQDDPAWAPRRSSRAGAVPCPEHRHSWAQQLLRPLFSHQLCFKSSKPVLDPLENAATIPGNPKLPKSGVSSPNQVPSIFVGLCFGWNKTWDWCSSPFLWQGHRGHEFKYTVRSLSIFGKAQHPRGTGRGWAPPLLAQPVELLPPSPLEPTGTWHQGQARLRARHLGTSHSSCHLPAAHLAIPAPPVLPLCRGLLCSAPWCWHSHPALPPRRIFLLGGKSEPLSECAHGWLAGTVTEQRRGGNGLQ